jgi:acetyltransferase-like isoleucine patch superfamily enzyme
LTVHGALRIGAAVRINSGRENYVGIDRRLSIWVAPGAEVVIHDGCALSNSTLVALQRIVLHHDTFVGGGCEIYDSDFHPLEAPARIGGQVPAPTGAIEIGPRAFIGAGSIILKGVTIGEEAVIGAGSVITRSVPRGEVWAGRPARRIRSLADPAAKHG